MTTIELSAAARRHLLDTLQIGAGVLAVGALLLAPPAKGTIAFYPLTVSAKRSLPMLATSEGRKLLSKTALANGYIVTGTRPAFADLLFNHGIIALAVADGGCIGTAK